MTAETEAELLRGVELARTGDLHLAEELFLGLLARERGRGNAFECRILGNLGTVYNATGRRFEAILLYRRGLAIARALHAVPLQVGFLANLSGVYGSLNLWSLVKPILDESDRLVESVEPEQRNELVAMMLWSKIYHALNTGQPEVANELVPRFREVTGGELQPALRAHRHVLEAELRLQAHDLEGALAELETALAVEGLPPLNRVYVLWHRVGFLSESDRKDEARREAASLALEIDALAAGGSTEDVSVDVAADLAALLADDARHAATARRLYDLAASVLLRRMAALDRCAQRAPEITGMEFEDRVWIGELRERFRRERKELQDAVGDLFRRSPEAAALFTEPGEEDARFLCVCAWCSRLRTTAGHWLPIVHYFKLGSDFEVTHGLCPECEETVRTKSTC